MSDTQVQALTLAACRKWARSQLPTYVITERGEGVITILCKDIYPPYLATIVYPTTMECYRMVHSYLRANPPSQDDGDRGDDRRYW